MFFFDGEEDSSDSEYIARVNGNRILSEFSDFVDDAADPMDTEYYAFVLGNKDNIDVKIYGNKTKMMFVSRFFDNIGEFLRDAPKTFSNKKMAAVLLCLDNVETGFNLNASTRRKLDTIQHDVKYYFMGNSVRITTQLLIAANISAAPGDIILAVDINDPPGTCGVYEIRYTEHGFQRCAFRIVDPKSKTLSKNANRQQILGSNVASKIIMQVDKPGNQLMRILRDKLLAEECDKHIIVEEPLVNFADEFVLNSCKWILDRTYTKFHVIPRTCVRYVIGYELLGHSGYILDTEDTQFLPYSVSRVIPKSHFRCFVGYVQCSSRGAQISETFELPEKAHQHQITLNIDVNSICNFDTTPIINDKIAALPETLSKMSTSKAPVIGLFEDISVICLPKDDGGYEFMEKWDGIYGKDLFISFDKEEPQFFGDAVKTYKAKQSHVVHNLLKIISMTYDDAKEKLAPRLPFKLLPGVAGETLIQFTNYDGKPKTATPLYIMSLILKEHLKAVEPDSGEKPKEIGFCVFGDFDEEAKKRIEKCLEDFCKLRAINCFVIHENA